MQHLPKQSAENTGDFWGLETTKQEAICDFWGSENDEMEMSNLEF